MKSGGAKERNKMASGAGGMGNAGGKVDDWQRMLVERPRTAAEKRKGLKCVESGGEGEVAWGEEKRKRRETEKQTWRRWGIDGAESWVIPAVNLCVCVCARTPASV